MPKVPKIAILQYLCNISREGSSWIFCIQITIRLFYKLILSILVGIASHTESTQNKLAKSLLYLKKEGRDEFVFFFEQIMFSTSWYYHIWWVLPGMCEVLKITSMWCLCNISRKKCNFWSILRIDTIFFDRFG